VPDAIGSVQRTQMAMRECCVTLPRKIAFVNVAHA
jgi:hypothetical protein